ncbi:MAG: type II secretion system F family protein [Bacillota bacterium]
MSAQIATLCGLLTFLIAFQLEDILTARQRKIKERLKMTAGQAAPQAKELSAAKNPVLPVRRTRLKLPSIPALGSVLGKAWMDRIKVNLTKAGIPLRPEELAGMSVTFGAAGLVAGLLTRNGVALPLAFAVAGAVIPSLWVRRAIRVRAAKLEIELVDALTLIANSLRAGHSFMQALELVGKDAPPPLGPELAKVLRDSRLGMSIDDAFAGLLSRFESRDLELAVTGVLIQRQVGGNLAQVLDSIASTIEKRIKARGKIRTLTAQGRLSAWVISLLPFAMAGVMFSMYPDFSSVMLKSPLGIGMLAVGAVSLTFGIILVRKVVTIDV